MGHDSHFVLQFSSVFSVGMYICSVLQVETWQENLGRMMEQNRNLKRELVTVKAELEAV